MRPATTGRPYSVARSVATTCGALARPARLGVAAAQERLGQRLDPGRVDARGGAAPQAPGLDQLGHHHPVGRAAGQARAGEDRKARAARAEVLAPRRVLDPDVGEQAGQQRRVDLARLGGRLVALDADLAGGLAQLGDEVLPLAHAQVVQVLGLAALAELVARERALLLAQVAPQVEVGEEVRAVVGEAGVRLVGLRALLDRTLARVDDRERSGDHDHLLRAAGPPRLEHHPAEARIDRQLRELAAQRRQPAARVERGQLLQEKDPVAHLAAVGRVQEREGLDVAEADRRHLQDHRGEARAQDLRVGVARALGEVLLAVEPDADAVGLAPAAARRAGRRRPGRSARSAGAGPSAARCSG